MTNASLPSLGIKLWWTSDSLTKVSTLQEKRTRVIGPCWPQPQVSCFSCKHLKLSLCNFYCFPFHIFYCHAIMWVNQNGSFPRSESVLVACRRKHDMSHLCALYVRCVSWLNVYVDSLAALVVLWGRKHCAAPASSAAGFVNAGRPGWREVKRVKCHFSHILEHLQLKYDSSLHFCVCKGY